MVTRFDVRTEDCEGVMAVHPSGDYVEWEAYQDLLDDKNDLEIKLAMLEDMARDLYMKF